MIKVEKTEDVYPAIKELITELKSAGQSRLATTLYHRMYEAVWTTGSELFEELQRIATQALKDNNLPQSLKTQIEQILLVINKRGSSLDKGQVGPRFFEN